MLLTSQYGKKKKNPSFFQTFAKLSETHYVKQKFQNLNRIPFNLFFTIYHFFQQPPHKLFSQVKDLLYSLFLEKHKARGAIF